MFINQTIISGTNNNGFKCLIMRGHWNIQSAITRARKSGISDEISIKHSVSDTSGGGRGGHDGRYAVDAENNIANQSDWSEFGVEH